MENANQNNSIQRKLPAAARWLGFPWSRCGRFLLVGCTLFLATQPTSSLADTFHLKSGGTLKGKLLNAEEKPRKSYRIRLDKGGDVRLATRDVTRVQQESAKDLQYQSMLKEMPDTVDAHLNMAKFCKTQRMETERKFHLEQVLRLEPDHEHVRAVLKYKRAPDGSWAKIEEIRAAKGFVRHKGKWVTKEQALREEMAEKRAEQQIEWKKRIKRWRDWLGNSRRSSKGLAAFKSIDDPLAVAPLSEMFWEDENINVRELIAEQLGKIGGPSAAQVLARAAMQGGDRSTNELRRLCVRILRRSKMRGVASGFVPSLGSSSNSEVNRAGYALGELADESVVLPLIKALNTTHIKLVGGQGNGRINATRGGVSMGQSKPKKVPVSRENKDVRDALVKLTDGVDFGYNETRWLQWYAAKRTPPQLDLRRDL